MIPPGILIIVFWWLPKNVPHALAIGSCVIMLASSYQEALTSSSQPRKRQRSSVDQVGMQRASPHSAPSTGTNATDDSLSFYCAVPRAIALLWKALPSTCIKSWCFVQLSKMPFCNTLLISVAVCVFDFLYSISFIWILCVPWLFVPRDFVPLYLIFHIISHTFISHC